MKKLNSDRLFEEILEIYFSKDDMAQFQMLADEKEANTNRYTGQAGLTEAENEQIKFEPDKGINIQPQIDLLLTFASEKLSTLKYLGLVQNLGQYCITIGELNSSAALYEKIISETIKDKRLFELTADAFASLSEIYRRKAEWKQSFSYARKASDIYKKHNDTKGSARCANLLGTIYGEQSDFRKAKQYFEQSLELLGKSKNSEFKGKIEINLGIINNILGSYNEALSYFNRALITYNKISDFKRIAEIQHNIAMMHINTQKPKTAIKEFDKSISTCMKIGYLPILGISYLGKSYSFTLQEDYNLADAFADKAMQICHKLDDKLSIADVYKIKGIIQRNLKNYDKAENYLNTSMRINKELGNKLNEAETSYELGVLYKNTGKVKRSKSRFAEALNYFKSLKADLKVKEIKEQIASLAVY